MPLGFDGLLRVGNPRLSNRDFLSMPRGKGYAFVGPELKDPKYVGEGAGIAVRKGNTELVAELNKAIDGIRANGQYQQISQKYFKSDIYGD